MLFKRDGIRGVRVSPRGIQRAEFGLCSVTEVSPGIYQVLHQDFTDWIDFSPGHRESQQKGKGMRSLNRFTAQHTLGAQIQGTFVRVRATQLNAKSDEKTAGLRRKPAGALLH